MQGKAKEFIRTRFGMVALCAGKIYYGIFWGEGKERADWSRMLQWSTVRNTGS